ncbi:hypothetical protein EJC49_10915 [Aquibium carbonis]|uniref:PIN domain-containing protein n=1 Tax=Aquibium carbonis TaxID=2495581 RepID=A0A3S0AT43_9HYPH|nr:hypothetical protein [Aquibium carbonis]RST86484.1 hypothetical protein EJC49_10915 [Aquibium carbonis]
MVYAVIDTNVLLVANGNHEGISDECRQRCIERLLMQQKRGITVIDDCFHILREYQNKTHPNQPKGVGDVFLKWLLQNQRNQTYVEQVTITEIGSDQFVEFPDQRLEPHFDAPDRKFAAVANAHPEKPKILQAADCKWLDWWETLRKHGIAVEFLCPEDACHFYKVKFPNNASPKLPK